jgi:peptidoglycan/xylan/chitin deacetylase (PgdA/CDA1 family)
MNKNIFKIIRYSGLPFLFRELFQRNKITIILFHDISIEKATRVFSFLKKYYNVIRLSEYLEAVKFGLPLPPKSMIITFDDGLAGNYKLLPLIKKLQLPITIFLCSDIVGTHRHFWFSHIEGVISDEEIDRMKLLPHSQRLKTLESYGFNQTQEYDDIHALTQEQIKEMSAWVDFQSHTCFHPILPQCDDETAKAEILLSKQHLEQEYSFVINTLSYPNGDYSSREISLAKESGYTCGITLDPGYNSLNTDLFRLKRFPVNEACSMDEFVVKASGCYAIVKNLLKKRKALNK